jgi:hypothetical protein
MEQPSDLVYISGCVLSGLSAQCGCIPASSDIQDRIVNASAKIAEKMLLKIKADTKTDTPKTRYMADALQSIYLICRQKGDDSARFDEIAAICQRIIK